MSKKHLYIVLATILLLIFVLWIIKIAESNYIPEYNPNELNQNIKDITSDAKIIDANLNHNQALDVAEFAKNNNIEVPSVLINFDTHSDIYLNINSATVGIRISNWINELLVKNPQITEIYWVMPKEEAQHIGLRILFALSDKLVFPIFGPTALYGNSLQNISLLKFIMTPLTKEAYTQTFLINPFGKMNEYADNKTYKRAKINFDNQNPNLRKIKIITCTENTLPDFQGKKVFLSIDADYLSNSGFDTIINYKNTKNQKQLNYAIFSMVKTIKEKNIKPEIINLTLSPQYLPEDKHKYVIDFYNKIFEISKQKDALQNYKNQIDEDTLQEYKIFRKNKLLYFFQI